jgi:hypothetical protein
MGTYPRINLPDLMVATGLYEPLMPPVCRQGIHRFKIYDVIGQCVYANDRWSEITGLTRTDVQGTYQGLEVGHPVGVLLKLVECYKIGSNASVVKPANLQEWLKS